MEAIRGYLHDCGHRVLVLVVDASEEDHGDDGDEQMMSDDRDDDARSENGMDEPMMTESARDHCYDSDLVEWPMAMVVAAAVAMNRRMVAVTRKVAAPVEALALVLVPVIVYNHYSLVVLLLLLLFY